MAQSLQRPETGFIPNDVSFPKTPPVYKPPVDILPARLQATPGPIGFDHADTMRSTVQDWYDQIGVPGVKSRMTVAGDHGA